MYIWITYYHQQTFTHIYILYTYTYFQYSLCLLTLLLCNGMVFGIRYYSSLFIYYCIGMTQHFLNKASSSCMLAAQMFSTALHKTKISFFSGWKIIIVATVTQHNAAHPHNQHPPLPKKKLEPHLLLLLVYTFFGTAIIAPPIEWRFVVSNKKEPKIP